MNKVNRIAVASLAILAVVLLAYFIIEKLGSKAVAGLETSSSAETVLEQTQLRLRWLNQAQFAGIYMAEQTGIFERHGIDVSILPGGPNINYMQLVATGAEDFGIAGAAQILEARDKGFPVVALAVFFQKNPNVFFSKKVRGIKSIADWKGKIVANFAGYDLEYMLRAILQKNGMDEDSIQMYPATFDMSPFFNDQVDIWGGYVINQPNTAEEKGFEIDRFLLSDYEIDVPGDTLFTTESVIINKPEVVQAMVASLVEGWRYALSNKEQALAAVMEVNPSSTYIHEKKMLDSVESLFALDEYEIGHMDAQQWKELQVLWLSYGGINKELEVSKLFNRSFVVNSTKDID